VSGKHLLATSDFCEDFQDYELLLRRNTSVYCLVY